MLAFCLSAAACFDPVDLSQVGVKGADGGVPDGGVPDGGKDAGVDAGPEPLDAGCVPLVNQWLAFSSAREATNSDLYVVRPGCAERRLTSLPGNERQPAFSPDGTRLVFVSDNVGFELQLVIMTLADGGLSQLTTVPGAEWPSWSPDSAEIVFNRGADLVRMSASGGPEQVIASGPDLPNRISKPVFRPDGNRIIAADFNSLVFLFLDGGVERRGAQLREPSPSPDGFSLAATGDCELQPSVWVVSSGGSEARCEGARLASAPSSAPAWGATHLAWEQGSVPDIVIGQPGGPTLNVTSHPAADRTPAWAPVGTEIP